MYARDIMDHRFHTLKPDDTVLEAVKQLYSASQAQGKKIFGLMVTDEEDQLVGMLSMYDILLFIQPKHIHIWGEMEDLDPGDLFDERLESVKRVQVKDLMSTDLVTVTPYTHVFRVVDIMIKQHMRRIPVVDDKEVVGIIYRTSVFYSLLKKFTDTPDIGE